MGKAKILYVDDEEINLMIFEINLKTKYNVVTALSGRLGLEVLSQTPDIAVVVSDMRMPVMDGLEFIKKAKELYANITFYILTGFDINEEIQKALNQGLIQKYFQKPFNMKEIDEEIERVITD